MAALASAPLSGRVGKHVLAPVAVGLAVGAVAAGALARLSPTVFALLALAAVGLLAALVVHDLRRLLLALVLLDIPFQWDKNFDYREALGSFHAIGGWNVSLSTIALAGLYVLWAASLASRDSEAARPRLRPAAVPLLYFVAVVLSVAVAQNRLLAGFEIGLLAQMLLLFVYVASTVRTRRDVHFIVVMLLVGLTAESLALFAFSVAGHDLNAVGIANHTQAGPDRADAVRAGGTIGAPNQAGSYFAFYAAVALAVAAAPLDRVLRRLAGAACLLGVVALALTQSRGAWLGFAVSLAVLLAGSSSRGRRTSRKAVVGTIAVLAIALLPLAETIGARLTGPDAGAAASRIPLMKIAWHVIEHNALLGVGANNFAVAAPKYIGPDLAFAWISTVHNKYLLVWAETGLVGLVLFLAFIVVTLVRGWRTARSSDPLLSTVGLGLTAALAGLAVHMNVDIFAGRPLTQTLWLAAGLLAATTVLARSPERVAGVLPRRLEPGAQFAPRGAECVAP